MGALVGVAVCNTVGNVVGGGIRLSADQANIDSWLVRSFNYESDWTQYNLNHYKCQQERRIIIPSPISALQLDKGHRSRIHIPDTNSPYIQERIAVYARQKHDMITNQCHNHSHQLCMRPWNLYKEILYRSADALSGTHQ